MVSFSLSLSGSLSVSASPDESEKQFSCQAQQLPQHRKCLQFWQCSFSPLCEKATKNINQALLSYMAPVHQEEALKASEILSTCLCCSHGLREQKSTSGEEEKHIRSFWRCALEESREFRCCQIGLETLPSPRASPGRQDRRQWWAINTHAGF